jgi:hypothetical protein
LPMGSRFFVKAILQPNEGLTMIELEEALWVEYIEVTNVRSQVNI